MQWHLPLVIQHAYTEMGLVLVKVGVFVLVVRITGELGVVVVLVADKDSDSRRNGGPRGPKGTKGLRPTESVVTEEVPVKPGPKDTGDQTE